MESDCQFFAVPPQLYAAAVDDDGRLFSQTRLSGDPAAAAAAAAAGRVGGGGGGGERKRRFTEEQVRSLEATFHSRRAKALEPQEKTELARELGLQPRQVSIWFQNKRARWRSKQLEQDFADLRAHYNALRARVESLKQEKHSLAARLEELKEKLNKRPQDHQSAAASCIDSAEVDGKRNSVSCVLEEEDSAAGWYDHLACGGGQLLPETFCSTPELWAETWPPVEWNLVA